jgi:ABC-type polysaccharide/polyol phosphate export permease
MASSKHRRSLWYQIPVRVVLWTFIGTLISFAVSLFVGIIGLVIVSVLRHVHPNMTLAYRDVAFPSAVVAGTVILLCVLWIEIRDYRQNKTLEAIERAG